MATIAEIADMVGVSESAMAAKMREGLIPKGKRGDHDLKACVQAYCADLREKAAGRRSESDDLDIVEERARLAKAQADAQEMKNATMRGELLPRGEVHAAVVGAFARVRAKLLAIPSKAAPLVVGLSTPAEVQAKLSDKVNEALEELSETTVAGIPTDGGSEQEDA